MAILQFYTARLTAHLISKQVVICAYSVQHTSHICIWHVASVCSELGQAREGLHTLAVAFQVAVAFGRVVCAATSSSPISSGLTSNRNAYAYALK